MGTGADINLSKTFLPLRLREKVSLVPDRTDSNQQSGTQSMVPVPLCSSPLSSGLFFFGNSTSSHSPSSSLWLEPKVGPAGG